MQLKSVGANKNFYRLSNEGPLEVIKSNVLTLRCTEKRDNILRRRTFCFYSNEAGKCLD